MNKNTLRILLTNEQKYKKENLYASFAGMIKAISSNYKGKELETILKQAIEVLDEELEK